MDILLSILGIICILASIGGAFLPALPGPPLAWAGILLLHFTRFAEFSWWFLVLSAVIMAVVTLLDYYIPIWGTKKFGGTKAGVAGSTIGLVLGVFFIPPLGVVLGPFIGALVGEMIADPNDARKALFSAVGSFVGFVAGTLVKLAYCGVMAFFFVKEFFW